MTSKVLFIFLLSAACIGQSIAQSLSYQDSPFGFTSAINQSDAVTLGAKWLRYGGDMFSWREIEPQRGLYKWEKTDAIFSEASRNHLKLFVTLASLSRWMGPSNFPGDELSGDKDEYKDFLKKTVERYDGDGLDDAPGSPVVNVWQIENEVDLDLASELLPPAAVEDYVLFLKESYIIIKQTDPEAKVAMTGVGFLASGLEDFFTPVLEELDRIKESPSARYFDIFDFHWYPFLDKYNHFQESKDGIETSIYLDDYIDKIDLMLTKNGYQNMPLYITEIGQYSGLPDHMALFRSEKNQTAELLKLYVYPLAKGVDKIFWVTITEWPGDGVFGNRDGAFDNMGLINNPIQDGLSHKKLAYYTYKKMVEVLEGSDWDSIQTIQESDNVYLYKLTKTGRLIWVAWNDSSATQQISISGITSSQVRVTATIPKYESGKDVTDYSTTFQMDTLAVVNGSVSLQLGENPVFVEEFTITSIEDESGSIPEEFVLYQNYPNPFNPTTTIRFSLPQREFVTLKVFDVLGREIATLVNEYQQSGKYSIQLDVKTLHATSLPSGVYFYTLTVSPSSRDLAIEPRRTTSSGREFQETKKMILLK